MCPLTSPPNRGAPDWQGAQQWDGPLLWSASPGPIVGPVFSGVLPASAWAGTAVNLAVSAGVAALQVNWYADRAATIQLGQRFVVATPSIPAPYYGILRNQGPFIDMELGEIGGSATPVVNVFGTNRVLPVETPAAYALLISRQNVALGAASVDVLYPQSYYSGPVGIYAQLPAAGWYVTMQYLSGVNTWDDADTYAAGGLVDVTYSWIAPAGAWRMYVVNSTGAAGNYYLAVTPSTSGSS